MRRIARFLVFGVVLLAFTALFVQLPVTKALAQTVRAALVKNVDEPGRMPFDIKASWIDATITQCYNGCITIQVIGSGAAPEWRRWDLTLTQVPAGKKWVVQHVSGILPGTAAPAEVDLDDAVIGINPFGGGKWSFHGPFFAQRIPYMGFSAPAFTVYNASDFPHVHVSVTNPNDRLGEITVSGYLIDAVN